MRLDVLLEWMERAILAECLKIVLADANFPLDTYEKDRFILMEVVPGDPVVPVIWDEYKKILNEPVETGCVQQKGMQSDRWKSYQISC